MQVKNSHKLLPKITGLFFIILTLTAFSNVKDSLYYQSHLEEAEALMKGRCKVVGEHDNIFGKDFECKSVREAIAKSIEVKSRDALIDELTKKKEKLNPFIKIGDEDKQRYNIFKKRFSEDLESTGDFIIECFKSDKRVAENGVECVAAVDEMLETLTKERDSDAAANEKEIKYKENYQRNFRENPAKIDELLDGRCKDLFANPWYQYDISLQDKECNIAVSEKIRQKRLSAFAPKVETKQEDQKTVDLFQLSAARKKYLDDFKANITGAKKVVDDCNSGKEVDKTKCEAANTAYNLNLNGKRDKKEFERFINYYRDNEQQAKNLLNGKCKNFKGSGDSGIFIEDSECAAVIESFKINEAVKGRDELIGGLRLLKRKIAPNFDKMGKEELVRYSNHKDYFKQEPTEAEKFIASCVSNGEDAKRNSTDCVSAIDSILNRLEDEKERDLARQDKESKYKEYYRKYFRENHDEANKLLEGRCKILFADPWYGYDPDTQDRECDAAKFEIQDSNKNKQAEELAKQKTSTKDMAYYRKNTDETAALLAECTGGVVNDLRACEMSLKVTREIEQDAKKRVEYQAFYSGHILAAQFHLRWCKSVMLNFDSECQVVDDILKDHKDRVEDPELAKEYAIYFAENPMEAKMALLGDCAEKIADSWYFLDRNLQTERCNAAVDFLDSMIK
jgi:hypothetical protein